eukprot:9763198-Alexandrium_andersonii.AAC.1
MNASLDMVGPVQARLAAGTLCDIAGDPALTGQAEPIKTCLAHGSKAWTRRDYIFVPRMLRREILQVIPLHAYGLDVHTPLLVR